MYYDNLKQLSTVYIPVGSTSTHFFEDSFQPQNVKVFESLFWNGKHPVAAVPC